MIKEKINEEILNSVAPCSLFCSTCTGCRNGRANGCSIKNCIIPESIKEHNISFCAECKEFPCNKINESIYKKTTIEKWLKGNAKIKNIGIEKYYEENKNKPHYINYKSNCDKINN